MDTPRFFSTKTKGVGGQIKRRYTDFVVEEITPEGKICEVKRFLGEEKELAKIKVPERKKDGKYLHLDLEKINKDLNFAISKISRFLGVSRKRVGYAGIKDKRGVTCQRISIFDPPVARVEEFNSRGIELRNPKWEKERINLGDLKENKFTVTIRDISLSKKEIRERIEWVRDMLLERIPWFKEVL